MSPLSHSVRFLMDFTIKRQGSGTTHKQDLNNASNARLAPSCVCQEPPNTAARGGAPAPNTNNQQSRRTPCRRTGNRWIPRPNPLTVSLHLSCTSPQRDHRILRWSCRRGLQRWSPRHRRSQSCPLQRHWL